MKRGLLILLAVIASLFLLLVALVVPAFAGMKPITDGATLPNGVTQVKDAAGSLFVIPIGPGAVALVDCGMTPDAAGAVKDLAKRGLGPEAVKAILLTHGHPDHVGGCGAFPHAEVMALAEDVPYASGTEHAHSLAARLLPDPGHYTKVTRVVHDGDRVTLGTTSATVYAAAGHTPGSAAYLINGTLYLGDLVMAKADGTVKDCPWFFSDDQEKNRASTIALAQRLASENAPVRTLAFSHSGTLEGLAPLLKYGK